MKNNVVMKLRSTHPAIWMMSVAAFIGALISYVNTRWGVLVDSDSYFYLTAAKNFIAGIGLGRLSWNGQLIPLTHYPPLYPLLVGEFSLFTQRNVLLSARITACLLFGINAFLFGFLINHYTRSLWAGLAGAVVFLFSTVSLSVIVAGLSEGLFFVFLFLALFCITETTGSSRKCWLIGAAVCSALACLTRYVGIAVILACLIPLLLNQKPWKDKLRDAVLFGIISGLPIGLWYLRDYLLTGSATNRVFEFHLPGWTARNEAILTAAGWFFPGKITLGSAERDLLLIGLAAVFVFASWVFWLRKISSGQTEKTAFRFACILVGFILVYCIELLVSRTFLDASTHWDTRILSPLYLTGLLLFTTIFWFGLRIRGWQLPGKLILAAVGVYLVLFNYPQSTKYLQNYAQNGLGYTNAAMQKSSVMAFLESYPDNGRLYSNNAAALYFNVNRLADWIPEEYDSVKALPRPDYPQNLSLMRKDLQTPDSFLVIFKPYMTDQSFPPLNELTAGLTVVKDYQDATIYAYPAK